MSDERLTPRHAEATLPPDGAEAEVRSLWPALYAETVPNRPREALPPPAVELAPFLEARVPGPPGPTWPGRKRDLAKHFRALEPEFAGRLRATHLLACCIVVLRRYPKSSVALKLFRRITAEHGAVVAAEMNLRWLTSVCDTFCDFGKPEDRALGLAGTLAANFVKLVETERRVFGPPRPWPPKHTIGGGSALFDGVILFWVSKGDMIANMLERASKVLEGGGTAAPFTREILARLTTHDTTLRRMIEVNDGRAIPKAPMERIEALRRLMSDL